MLAALPESVPFPCPHPCFLPCALPLSVMMMFDGISVGSGSFAHLPPSNVAGLAATLAVLQGGPPLLPPSAAACTARHSCLFLRCSRRVHVACSGTPGRAGAGGCVVGADCVLQHPLAGPLRPLCTHQRRRLRGSAVFQRRCCWVVVTPVKLAWNSAVVCKGSHSNLCSGDRRCPRWARVAAVADCAANAVIDRGARSLPVHSVSRYGDVAAPARGSPSTSVL